MRYVFVRSSEQTSVENEQPEHDSKTESTAGEQNHAQETQKSGRKSSVPEETMSSPPESAADSISSHDASQQDVSS